MAGLVPAIHVVRQWKFVDVRHKAGRVSYGRIVLTETPT
jgi:hypothetical protein